MRILPPLLVPVATFGLMLCAAERINAEDAAPEPLQVLLVTGGGNHDYPTQAKILAKGLEERLHCKMTANLSNDEHHPAYGKPGWAEGYDMVIHNTCNSADTNDPELVKIITEEHARGVPAAVVHCAMHCFRSDGPHEYQELLGVSP